MANHQHIQTGALLVQRWQLCKTCLCGSGDSENSDCKDIGTHELMYYLYIYNTHTNECMRLYQPTEKKTNPPTGDK